MLKWTTLFFAIVQRPHRSIKNTARVRYRSGNCGNIKDKIRLPERYGTGERSVWIEYSQLAAETKPAVNLGQGFPDYQPPIHVREALAQIAVGENALMHQYTRGFGHPRLVQALAKHYSPLVGRDVKPMSELLVACGAYEALFCAVLGHVDFGENVIVIEPFFDCYDFMVRAAGGKPRFIALKPRQTCGGAMLRSSDWVLDWAELESLFDCNTKMIIINTPHNPLGKVFSCEELEMIANLCKKHNVLCLSDEVYEWLVYDGNEQHRIATFPGMWERTITVGSAGKTYCVTGWKIGWAYGPAELLLNMQVIHQNCVFTSATPLQEALARAFEIDTARRGCDDYFFRTLMQEVSCKRELMIQALVDGGFNPTIPEGGFFALADWSPLEKKIDLSSEQDKYKDYKFTKKYAKEAGVLAIPPTAFYSEPHKQLGENYARFCFIKKDENILLAGDLMKKWNQRKTQTKHK